MLEVVMRIVQHLWYPDVPGGLGDLYNCARVNREWNRVAIPILYSQVSVGMSTTLHNYVLPPDVLERLLQHLESNGTLFAFPDTTNSVKGIRLVCEVRTSALTDVHMACMRCALAFLLTCKRLRSLELKLTNVPQEALQPLITTLTQLAQQTSQLRQLSVLYYSEPTLNMFQGMSDKADLYQLLKHLALESNLTALSFTSLFTPPTLTISVLQAQSRLTYLKVLESTMQMDEPLPKHLEQRLTALETLWVIHTAAMQQDVLKQTVMPRLHLFASLYELAMPVYFDTVSVDELMCGLATLPRLNVLTLFTDGDSRVDMQIPSPHLPQLTILQAFQEPGTTLSGDAMTWLAACTWPNLRTVMIERGSIDCTALSNWLNHTLQLVSFQLHHMYMSISDSIPPSKKRRRTTLRCKTTQHQPIKSIKLPKQSRYTQAFIVDSGFLNCRT